MLLSEYIEVNVSMDNYDYYFKKGYDIPTHIVENGIKRVPHGTKIRIKTKDATCGCGSLVNVKCDYCGKEYQVPYSAYLTSHKHIQKDSCGECKSLKTQDWYKIKYGTTSMKIRSDIEGFQTGRHLKYTIEDIIEYFKSRGLVVQTNLLQSDKIHVKDKIPYICTKHPDLGIQYVTFDNLKKRQSCCSGGYVEDSSARQRQCSIEEVTKICNNKGYKLLTKSINNIDDTVKFICGKHINYGIQTTSLYNLRKNKCNCLMCRVKSKKDHWNWQGGISKERDKIKESIEYKQWRNSVFERDLYTCQCCGKRGGILNAHHILNFSTYPELRFDVNNGITLCADCHAVSVKGSFHNLYGTYNNNAEQLEEYIKLKNNAS